MIVRMFKPRFAPLVKSGVKKQTIRPWPKRVPVIGEEISLRQWEDKPYRSKQIVLCDSVVTRIATVEITETGVIVDSYAEPCDAFAVADGFKDFFDLRDWFAETHGLPFSDGILIVWK